MKKRKFIFQVPLSRFRREYKSLRKQFANNQRLIVEITHKKKTVFYMINTGLLAASKASLLCMKNTLNEDYQALVSCMLDHKGFEAAEDFRVYGADLMAPDEYLIPLFEDLWFPIPDANMESWGAENGNAIAFTVLPERQVSLTVIRRHVTDNELSKNETWSRIELRDLSNSEYDLTRLCEDYLMYVLNHRQ